MTKQRLREIARREVAATLRRATVLDGEAKRDKCLARMMPTGEAQSARRQAMGKAQSARRQAMGKAQRARRLRQIAGRLAAAHHIGNRSGRGGHPPAEYCGPLTGLNAPSKQEVSKCSTKRQ